MTTATPKNEFKVPMRQWRKWSGLARSTFNRVYDFAFNNMMLLNHPKAPPLTPAEVGVLAWNVAWIAADAVDDVIPDIVEDINVRTGKTVRLREVRSALQ
jgi:hypothetical protein